MNIKKPVKNSTKWRRRHGIALPETESHLCFYLVKNKLIRKAAKLSRFKLPKSFRYEIEAISFGIRGNYGNVCEDIYHEHVS